VNQRTPSNQQRAGTCGILLFKFGKPPPVIGPELNAVNKS